MSENYQLESSAAGSSSLHYHRCWWAWCRESFCSRNELSDHLKFVHVLTARPERLQDVPAHKAEEDEYWDSLDMPDMSFKIPWNSLDSVHPSPHSSNPREPKLLPSPSPPTPTPPSVSPPSIQVHRSEEPKNDLSSQINLPRPHQPSPIREDMHGGTNFLKPNLPGRDAHTPTFGSLSSQAGSPPVHAYPVPDSPSFQSLVEDAIRSSQTESAPYQDADTFRTEMSSQDIVSQQLTQGLVDDFGGSQPEREDEGNLAPDSANETFLQVSENDARSQHHPRSSPAFEQGEYHNVNILSSPNSPRSQLLSDASPAGKRKLDGYDAEERPPKRNVHETVTRKPPDSPSNLPLITGGWRQPKQSWYQAFSPRKSRKQPFNHPPTNVHRTSRTPSGSPIPSPLASSNHNRNLDAPETDGSQARSFLDDNDISHPQQGLSSQSQDPWDGTCSLSSKVYPPTQTQAPYRSQSLSEDDSFNCIA